MTYVSANNGYALRAHSAAFRRTASPLAKTAGSLEAWALDKLAEARA